ncbi:MAG: bifunctional transaldolase/phosoglucose isomerase [Anaerolineales bacterium]
MNLIQKLHSLKQSIWYDNIQRKLLDNGQLAAMIRRGDIRGVTSNPSIFQNAIAKSSDYDAALIPLAWAGWDAEHIFWQLAVEDIQAACDLFKPLYEESQGGDGYVSLEVSPHLANDTDGTVEQAKALWRRVDRPNLMIKIPATKAGVLAVRQAIAAGINVNVTLIFSIDRYREVMDAYLSGLEDRTAVGQPVEKIASVASFFISRVDTKIDAQLPENSPLRGKAAIANARLAYEAFENMFTDARFHALQARFSARVQRPLWASTSTKNPAYHDTLYVDELIGPDTVNTVPPATLDAFRDHGTAALTLTKDIEDARETIRQIEAAGVSMAQVTQELEDEGVQAFADAFTSLLQTIEARREQAASQLGPLAASVSKRIAVLEADSVPARIWEHDPALWTDDPAGQKEVRDRLGWLDSPEESKKMLTSINKFADQVHFDGINRVLLLGMGGSSLAPEVLSYVFADESAEAAEGKPCLAVLDSTDPAQVAAAARDFPPEESLYIVASKSGTTAEVQAMFEYFWALSGKNGSRFVVITDPGTPLETLATRRGFRRGFFGDPQVGGRYSALTAFGLLPGALLGLDVNRLLARAAWMRAQSLVDVPAGRNPGLVLGAVMAEAAFAGRDKLTILADAPYETFGSWLEQLIAESSGKQGQGIIPIDREPPGEAADYSDDRMFVYLRNDGGHSGLVAELRETGHPVLVFDLPDAYDLGAEFYRWEFATAVACHILGVNAFDQPDVQDNKKRTNAMIAAYQKEGALPTGELVTLAEAVPALKVFFDCAIASDYIALNAYLPRNAEMITALQALRVALREKTGCAVTLGFGPRFLHSTGQLHKGGADNGLFLMLTADPVEDLDIPNQGMTFGTLERAQALGDYEALRARGRRVLRVHLRRPEDVNKLTELVK